MPKLSSAAVRIAYREWFATLPPDERRRLRKLRLRLECADPEAAGRGIPEGGEAEVCDAAELPEASYERHPVEDIEPLGPGDPWLRDVSRLSNAQIRQVGDAFTGAVAWALQDGSLPGIGRRLVAMVYVLRPGLVAAMASQIEAGEIEAAAARLPQSVAQRERVGALFGRVLEWLSRGRRLSDAGERLMAAASIIRPGLVDDKTNAAIGRIGNKTRQAINRKVQDFRDTFGGIRGAAMRGEMTRSRCRMART